MVMPTMNMAPHAYFVLGRQNQLQNLLKTTLSRILMP